MPEDEATGIMVISDAPRVCIRGPSRLGLLLTEQSVNAIPAGPNSAPAPSPARDDTNAKSDSALASSLMCPILYLPLQEMSVTLYRAQWLQTRKKLHYPYLLLQ